MKALTSPTRADTWTRQPAQREGIRQPARLNPLLRLSLALSLLITLICFLLIAISHLPGIERDPLAGLATCDDQPCYRGLQPGATPWDDALSRFGGETRIFSDTAYSSIVLFPALDGRSLDAVLLNRPRDNQITVGAVLAHFGRPTCAQIYPNNGYFILHYPTLHVTSRFEGQHFRPQNPVISIMVGDRAAGSADEGFVCAMESALENRGLLMRYDWQGFAMMQRYLRLGA